MSEVKTKPTNQDPKGFLNTVRPEQKREDGFTLLKMFQKITGEKGVMWGTSIVGFGKYHFKSDRSTQEGDWPLVGFSPRKLNLTLYIIIQNSKFRNLLKKLGKYKTSKSCLYIKKLSDIDLNVLEALIDITFKHEKKISHQTA